jgi:hypothetical protein
LRYVWQLLSFAASLWGDQVCTEGGYLAL